MTDLETLKRHWPFAAAGFAAPLLGLFARRWMPYYLAVGVCAFVSFAAAVWLFQRSSQLRPTPGRSLMVSAISGLAAGIAAGAWAFLFPWH